MGGVLPLRAVPRARLGRAHRTHRMARGRGRGRVVRAAVARRATSPLTVGLLAIAAAGTVRDRGPDGPTRPSRRPPTRPTPGAGPGGARRGAARRDRAVAPAAGPGGDRRPGQPHRDRALRRQRRADGRMGRRVRHDGDPAPAGRAVGHATTSRPRSASSGRARPWVALATIAATAALGALAFRRGHRAAGHLAIVALERGRARARVDRARHRIPPALRHRRSGDPSPRSPTSPSSWSTLVLVARPHGLARDHGRRARRPRRGSGVVGGRRRAGDAADPGPVTRDRRRRPADRGRAATRRAVPRRGSGQRDAQRRRRRPRAVPRDARRHVFLAHEKLAALRFGELPARATRTRSTVGSSWWRSRRIRRRLGRRPPGARPVAASIPCRPGQRARARRLEARIRRDHRHAAPTRCSRWTRAAQRDLAVRHGARRARRRGARTAPAARRGVPRLRRAGREPADAAESAPVRPMRAGRARRPRRSPGSRC